MRNNLIKVDSLDFDGIKANIKTFLQGQDIFSDYNFEGSALSTLIDVFAYNLHYHSLYTNLALNESFLDSASKYSSAVSLSKTIGYTAKSAVSARAKIRVEMSDIDGDMSTVITLPKGTLFRGTVGNSEYIFQTMYAKSATLNNGKYVFDVDIIEGTAISTYYVNNLESTFVIPNENVDITALNVRVQENAGNISSQSFNHVTDLLGVTGQSRVYFVKQREDLFYEVYFGNDVIGKALSPGNVVFLDYIISRGAAANNAGQFYYAGGYRGDALYKVTTIMNAAGGANSESIESIKYNAPRNYVAQNRAVTGTDYITQILQNFPYVESVSVWGGEENFPPRYGSVFLCMKPHDRTILSNAEKQEIKNFIGEKRSMLAIDPIVVDPIYTNIVVKTGVYFDASKTNKTANDLNVIVKNSILEHINGLNSLHSSFRYSSLVRLIDNSDTSIVSNITSIMLKQKLIPSIGVAERYQIQLNNPVEKKANSILSSRFFVEDSSNRHFFGNDDKGNILLYENAQPGVNINKGVVGKIDFNTGSISIDAIIITALYDAELVLDIEIQSYDVIPLRNTIIISDAKDITVNIYADYDGSTDKIFSSVK